MGRLLTVMAATVLAIAPSYAQQPPVSRAKVVMLGTGVPGWNPDRFGPATAVVVDDTPYLVDFGPGVVRRAGAAHRNGISALRPDKIKVAFLTHNHMDHSSGYPDLIFQPAQSDTGRGLLKVFGPTGTADMTRYILKAYGKESAPRYQVQATDIRPGVVYRDDKVTVTAIPVRHRDIEAYGYRFDTPDRRIVISGDTTPTQSIIDACNGCDILVHEVYSMKTYNAVTPDCQARRRWLHTSTEQLAELATKARPKLLVIYHITNMCGRGLRSDPQDILNEIRAGYKGDVVVANDLDVF